MVREVDGPAYWHYQRLGGLGGGVVVFVEAEGHVEPARDAIGTPVRG